MAQVYYLPMSKPCRHITSPSAWPAPATSPMSADFIIGYTIEQDHPVNLDLKRFIKRSSGIFGATGTGKSFLTRIVLAGLMSQDAAAALVFDMHNEYAFDDTDADRGIVGFPRGDTGAGRGWRALQPLPASIAKAEALARDASTWPVTAKGMAADRPARAAYPQSEVVSISRLRPL